MTTLIALPDIHDQSESLKAIGKPLYEADAVLLVGDMTNGSISHLLRLMTILEDFNEQFYAVPGNLDNVRILAHLAREGLSIHRRHQILDSFALCGVGGALPFAGKFVFSEAQLAQFLDDTLTDLPAHMPSVLVCHQPPYGTACDRLASGAHVGSHAVRAWIERVQPLICFTGHIHEAVGIDRIGQTWVVNAGPLWQSNAYGFAEIVDGVVQTVEIRSFDPQQTMRQRGFE